MSDAIKNAIRTRLQQAGLSERHLDDAKAHVVASDGESLHVLVKDTKANQAIDTLQADVRDATGKALKAFEVREVDAIDLGELGQWRDFAVTGLAEVEKAAQMEAPPELHIVAKGDALAPEKAFHTTIHLPFAIYEVLRAEELFVRPIPDGERGGKEWVGVTPEMRGVLNNLLGRWFDDTVPAETMLAAAERWRELQDKVYASGLIGALTLGLAPQRPEVPLARVDGRDAVAKAAAKGGGLSEATLELLRDHGLEVPERLTVKWAEETLDQVTELPNAPDAVVAELRKTFRELKDKRAANANAMFGAPVEEPAAKPVDPGVLRRAQAEAIKYDRLVQALDKLDVPDREVKRLARELAIATEPRKYPSILFFAGPRHSAAEKMRDAAIELIGKKPLALDLTEPGFAQVFGHYKGVPTQADAALSETVMNKTRGHQAAHLAITVDNLGSVGSAANDPDAQKAALVDWLERVDEMLRTGTTESFSRGKAPVSERRTTPLANTVFVFGWRGEPAELEKLFEEHPHLAHLESKVFTANELAPAAGVANLEAELTFRLRQHYGPKGAEVKLSDELKRDLTAAFAELGSSQGHDRFAEQLFVELYQVAKEVPGKDYVVHWSGGLTKRDKQKLALGQNIGFAGNLYGIEPR
ncbi:hypothetical protein L6R52_15675 [Myxococcota bacterium]|nr:hypothetical protein [Myxococcota bacterium]